MRSKFLINLIPIPSLRRKMRAAYREKHSCNLVFEIKADTKCLLIAPHADDELIGAGGVMLKYPKNFDVLCAGSSGTAYKELTAKERSDIRIKEFNTVMKELGVNKHWIFETYGGNVKIDQIEAHLQDYLDVLNTKEYDYIFMPVCHDRHPEHSFISNNLMKKILMLNGRKPHLIIVFYEVWSLIPNPNLFVDITAQINKKTELLGLYKSQHVWIDYTSRAKALNVYRGMQNDNADYSEAFFMVSADKYCKEGYNIPL